jgi:hypothetical protein
MWWADLLAGSFAVALFLVVPEALKLAHLGARCGACCNGSCNGYPSHLSLSLSGILDTSGFSTQHFKLLTFLPPACYSVTFDLFHSEP